ncbi:MAG: glycosyltransferase family 2 protein [Lachnospiraceae bacterium]|nr:glycosyltransferase family 2 protein [Lachnospiraceae bacterium]
MKKEKKQLLVIIPAYNEEKNIGELLDRLKEPDIASIADVLVMDDASKDKTRQIVLDKQLQVVSHVFNLGYGSGLQVGYKYAISNDYEYVIQMDADGQHDISNVLTIYNKLITPDENGKCPDIVLGSRFLEGSVTFPISKIKKVAINLFRFLIKLGTGQKIMDPTTGLQGLSKRAIAFYGGYNHFDDKYPDANMIMQMILLGYRVVEIPAVMHARTEGVSMHSGLKPILYMLRMMFSIIAVWVRIKVYKVDVGAANEDTVS